MQRVPVPNTGYIMHTARWVDIIYVPICTIHAVIIISDIICVDISLQHVPVPNTGHIMHTARWADIICVFSICTSFAACTCPPIQAT